MRQPSPVSMRTNKQPLERSPSLAVIKAAVLRDLRALTKHLHNDGRGLSDGMLFLMNAYQAAQCVPDSATVRGDIIRRAKAVAEEYNHCARSGMMGNMDVLLFELYYTTFGQLLDAKAQKQMPVLANVVLNRANVYKTPTSPFSRLYYRFALFWGGKLPSMRQAVRSWCCSGLRKSERTAFVTDMKQLVREMPTTTNESWTHNHYGYFSTLFFTQPCPSSLQSAPKAFATFLHRTLRLSTNDDYIGECAEQLILLFGHLDVRALRISYLLQRAEAASRHQGRTRHAILTASITPLCAYYSARKSAQCTPSTPLKTPTRTTKKRKASRGRRRRTTKKRKGSGGRSRRGGSTTGYRDLSVR